MKKAIPLMLVLILFFSMGACSKTETASEPATPTSTVSENTTAAEAKTPAEEPKTVAPEPVNMRIMWWGSQTRHDRTLAVLDLYTKQNPNVKFQPEFMGSTDYWQKLSTLVAANDVPDVFQIGNNFLTYFDAIEPLDQYVSKGLLDLKDTNENFLSTTKVKGQLLGVTLGTNSLALIYDPAVFEKAGVAAPTENWTWDEFKAAALKIKEKTGLFGSSGNKDIDLFIGLVISIPQYGTKETLFNSDGTDLGYSNDQFLADYLQMKYDLTKAKAYPTPGQLAEVKDIEGDLLVSGKAAMTWVHSNQAVALMTAAKRPLAITTPPKRTKDGPSGLCIRSSQAFSIYKGSNNKDEAAKFISFFVNNIEANKILDGERGVPMMASVRKELAASAPDINKQMYEFVDKAGNLASNPPPVEPASIIEITDILTRNNDEVMFGKTKPIDAAKDFRAKATEALKRTAK